MSDIKPRDYQREALDALDRGRMEGRRRQLVALPTGSGKTIVSAFDIMDVVSMTGQKALFTAHRDELITQAADKLRIVWPEADIGTVKAERNELGHEVTVASIQTIQGDKRLQQIVEAGPYGLFYIDEAHHAAAPTYVKVIEALIASNPDIVIVGLTATPVRADATKLSTVFDEITYQRTMLDLIEQGYLSDLKLRQIPLNINIDGIPRHHGDLKPSDVRKALIEPNIMIAMVDGWKAHAEGRRTIAFTVDVEHALNLAQAFKARGVNATYIHGDMEIEERRKRIAAFQSGKYDVVCNCMILCLDSETEILTDHGWTGMEEMSYEHKVANYDVATGDVTFEEPLTVVRRPRQPNERMVSLETPRRSIRVTEGHRMLYRTSDNGDWIKRSALELASKCVSLPVSTVATPEAITIQQERNLTEAQKRRRISASAYNLRRHNGLTYDESLVEAKTRLEQRISLQYTQPHELSLDDCMFIGFWIGDGSCNRLQSGGIEYRLVQTHRRPAIIGWVDALLDRLHVDYVRREKEHHVAWSLPRGTGSGPQKRKGLYHLEPYLDKSLPSSLWGLTEDQFDAFLTGIWLADGNHGTKGDVKHTRGGHQKISIYQSGDQMLSRLQALAVCRGWRASLRGPTPEGICTLSMTKRDDHRTTPGYTLETEETWKEEEVWCVSTRTSNLITRRKGSVTLMGNTEGFDDIAVGDADPLSCIMCARPTLSQSLYIQQVGRGTRPAPNKENCLILDFSYNSERHHVVQLPHLFGMEELSRTFKKKEEGEKEALEKHIPSILAAVREARDLDVHTPPPRAGFDWAKLSDGYALSLGRTHGFVLIREAEEGNRKFNVFHLAPPERVHDPEAARTRPEPQEYLENRLTSKPLDFDWAFGLAEDAVRELYEARSKGRTMSKSSFVDKDATWRNLPPTEAQLRVLGRRGKKAKNRGEANQWVTEMIVKRILDGRRAPTEKQLRYLYARKIEFDKSTITFAEARKLIVKDQQGGTERTTRREAPKVSPASESAEMTKSPPPRYGRKKPQIDMFDE